MKLQRYETRKSADIYVFIKPNNRCPTEDFFSELQPPAKNHAVALLNFYAANPEIRNTTKFKLYRDGIWCFKPTKQARLFCVFVPKMPKRTLVLLNGCIKKDWEADDEDVDRAVNLSIDLLNFITKYGWSTIEIIE